MRNFNLKEYVVRDDSGKIDQVATEQKFRDDLSNYLQSGDTLSEKAGKAVHAVFDKYKDAPRLPLPSVITYATQNIPPEEHPVMSAAVRDYIKHNSGEGGMFEILRGPGGGVRRLSTPPKTVTPSSAPARRNSSTKQRAVSTAQ